MKSSVYWGRTLHERYGPVQHRFAYPLYYFSFDLAELEGGRSPRGLFRHNRPGIFSLYDTDYISSDSNTIRDKLELFLISKGMRESPAATFLLTVPRYFGYVFNPVSFYISYQKDNSCHSIVAEVNNTFGDKHLYLLQPGNGNGDRESLLYRFPKQFHVSPFLDMSGEYVLVLHAFSEQLTIHITLYVDGKKMFAASLEGDRRPFSASTLCLTLLSYPLTPLLVMLRIHIQAFIIYFFRKAGAYERPPITGSCPMRSWIYRLRLFGLSRLSRFRRLVPGTHRYI
jgi:cyclopropane-fatty-acyl-phospholipid synthase